MNALEVLTRPKLERLLESGVRTAVIPFGSVEDQGGHLPLGSDAVLADVVGRAVAERLDAVVAPTVRVGCGDQHMEGARTLTVPAAVLREIAFHTARSLIVHGFRVVMLVSRHSGNHATLEEAAETIRSLHPDVLVCAPRGDVGPDPGPRSGRWLTSVMLSLHPDVVAAGAADAELVVEIARATPQAGAENLERYIAAIVRHVQRLIMREPSP